MTGLRGSATPLTQRYDVGLLDLDGVVYLGRAPIPGVPNALDAVREQGMRLAFVTNNASRTPEEVAALLSGMGVTASPAEIVTSAQAAARVLAENLPPGARVLVVGADALRSEVAGRGFAVTADAEDGPAAVVQGYSPDVGWPVLAEATVAVRRGAFWLATNTDITVPSVRGPLPGNGAMVAVVVAAAGRDPVVAGKPEPALHAESVARTAARRPLIVGDRLDTDIDGANRAGCDSLLVLSGVTAARDLLTAGEAYRPTFLAADAAGLLECHPAVHDGCSGGWRAERSGSDVVLAGGGADPLDALRAVLTAAWSEQCPVETVRGDGDAARAVVGTYQL